MFEPITILGALTAAGLISAVVGSAGRRARLGDAWAFSLAVGLGCYVGLAVLGVRPRWPIREDQDRFLGLVLPVILAAEAGFRILRLNSRMGFAARLVLGMAVAPAILHGSSYMVDLAGPGSAEWQPLRRGLILGGLGLATACNWSALVWMQLRVCKKGSCKKGSGAVFKETAPDPFLHPLAQATALLGAGPAVMLSGYASGGLIAFPLALALLGATASPARSAPGVGVVGLSSVLMMGAFFGRLGTVEAVVLFVAPLLAGVSEIVPRSRLGPRSRAALGLVLTASAVLAATASAWIR